jgi:hypothetical protein
VRYKLGTTLLTILNAFTHSGATLRTGNSKLPMSFRTPVDLNDIQDLANKGEIVIGVDAGHIVMAVSGDAGYSPGWETNLPNVMDTGRSHMWSKKTVNYSRNAKYLFF